MQFLRGQISTDNCTVGIQGHIYTRKPFVALRKEFGLLTNVAAILNLVMGSGIFITPATVLAQSQSLGLSHILWVVGGVIIFCGALCYLEMAHLVKKSGSTYIFIKEAYSFGRRKPWMDHFGSLCGFIVAWTDIAILQPLSSAIMALAIGQYTCRPFFIHCNEVPTYGVKLSALFWICLILMVNIFSIKVTVRFLEAISSVKLLVLASVVVMAVWRLSQHGFPETFSHAFTGSSTSGSSIALGFYGVLMAYGGWDTGIMVQEETQNARRNLSLAIFLAIPIITVTFTLVNLSFFSVLSYHEIIEAESVGLTFGYAVLGDTGLVVICVLVLVMILGSLHGNLIDSSRELLVCSREGSMPRFLSGVHVTLKTPVIALIFEAFLTCALILFGNIENFLDALSALEWTRYGAVFFGLIVMRVTEPDRPRPFKVLLFFPSVMIIVMALLVILPLWQSPYPQLMGFAASSLALPLYFVFILKFPCTMKTRIMDKISHWLVMVTSKLFNTQVHSRV